MSFLHEFKQNITRRYFFARGSHLLGGAALASLAGKSLFAAPGELPQAGAVPTHFPPKVKQIIYLVGSPGTELEFAL